MLISYLAEQAENDRFFITQNSFQSNEEVYFTEKDQWEEIKKGGNLLFGEVPMLEIDGLKIVQSGAIVRYLARIDMYYEGTRDFYYNGFPELGFMDEAVVLKKTKDVLLPKYLPVYEKILASSGKNYLVGGALSLADLGLLEGLLAVEEFFGTDTFETYPNLKAYYQNLTSLDQIAAFLSGPQRKKKNDEAYISNVVKILYS